MHPAEAIGKVGTILGIREEGEWPPNSGTILPKAYWVSFDNHYQRTEHEGVRIAVISEDLAESKATSQAPESSKASPRLFLASEQTDSIPTNNAIANRLIELGFKRNISERAALSSLSIEDAIDKFFDMKDEDVEPLSIPLYANNAIVNRLIELDLDGRTDRDISERVGAISLSIDDAIEKYFDMKYEDEDVKREEPTRQQQKHGRQKQEQDRQKQEQDRQKQERQIQLNKRHDELTRKGNKLESERDAIGNSRDSRWQRLDEQIFSIYDEQNYIVKEMDRLRKSNV